MNRYVKLILIVSIGVGMLGVGVTVWPEWVTGVMSHTSEAATAIHNLVTSLYLATTTTYQSTSSTHQSTSSTHQSTSSAHQGTSSKQKSSSRHRERIFTAQELQQYGSQGGNKGPYLAILGRVYNVKKGKEHYGPGGGYEFFSGRDGSRAFVTGDFTEEGLTDDISGLSSSDYIGLDEWVKFYESDYKYVGKLIGRFYDEKGEPTSQYYDAQRWISEAFRQRESEDQEKKMFPPCNSEWTPESGARLWCTNRSGGVERDWVGVPRKLYNPGHPKPRCACVKGFGPPTHDPTRMPHNNRGDLDHPNLEEYSGCVPDQPTCIVKDD